VSTSSSAVAERAVPAGIVDASIFASDTRLAGEPLLFDVALSGFSPRRGPNTR